MKNTAPLCENHEFRRLYHRGRSSVSSLAVIYLRKNRLDINRLGVTAGKKVGGAVQRNRARRLLKEAYRQLEPQLQTGYDIVAVARGKTVYSRCPYVKDALLKSFSDLGILK